MGINVRGLCGKPLSTNLSRSRIEVITKYESSWSSIVPQQTLTHYLIMIIIPVLIHDLSIPINYVSIWCGLLTGISNQQLQACQIVINFPFIMKLLMNHIWMMHAFTFSPMHGDIIRPYFNKFLFLEDHMVVTWGSHWIYSL